MMYTGIDKSLYLEPLVYIQNIYIPVLGLNSHHEKHYSADSDSHFA
jgi:hypothetical protein